MSKTNKIEAPKDSVLNEREKEVNATVNLPDYSEKEKVYLGVMRKRIANAQNRRDQNHEEFDNLSYIDKWWAEERWANTYIRAVANKKEVQFQSGTLRTKMMSVLNSVIGLNLTGDITAFDQQDMPMQALGEGMEDIIDKTNELENDKENKMLRQYELIKHGTVFVEDIWDRRYEIKKKLTSGKIGDFKNIKWTSEMVKVIAMPKRTTLSGPTVYLGDLTKYFIKNQPFIYTYDKKDWDEVKQIFKDFERINNVPRKTPDEMINVNWRLKSELREENEVEIIKYQDKLNNEFQIFLNSVPMLPIGFPLTAVTGDGEYSIVQQNLEPIRENFAYGKSFVFKNKNIVAVLDMMMKLGVLKTQKSFMPPYLNLSQRVISKSIFMPGTLSRGIKKGEIEPLSEHEVKGVTNSEFAMIQEVSNFIDRNTVSQTFAGSQESGKGTPTATQIIELQRQAKVMMGLNILAASLLEKKLTIKRMGLVLQNWFDPTNQVVDKAKNELRNKFRIVSRQRQIGDKGLGLRLTIPTTDKLPTSNQVKDAEKRFLETTGVPVNFIFLNPDELKQANIIWMVTVNAKEERSSELSKLMFGTMTREAAEMAAVGAMLPLNPSYTSERFAQVWDEDARKMFAQQQQLPPEQQGQNPAQNNANPTAPLQIKPPVAR